MEEEFRRRVAYKLRVGDIVNSKIVKNDEKLKFLEFRDKQVIRVNLIANIIDKYIQDSEKKFGSLTLDDATGQIRAKLFGEDIKKFEPLQQGDTIQVIGLARLWNNEIYITPEIMKKKDPAYLLIRKIEIESEQPQQLNNTERTELREKIIAAAKKEETNGGAEVEAMIMELNAIPDSINAEIKRLLEEGVIYEPRPGKIRYLG